MGYSIFCIGEAQSDLQGMDLLIYPRLSFGPNRLGLRFGIVSNDAWVLHWALHSFGLGEWDGEPIFLTPSIILLIIINKYIYIKNIKYFNCQ